jgi:membrane-bound ClpP family serine protease
MEIRMTYVNKIEVVTIIEGIIIMIFGAALFFALPMLITGLLGAVFLIVGVVVVIKGFFKKFRNP